MTISVRIPWGAPVATFGLGLVLGLACLPPLPALAGDRSVTWIEGQPDPAPAPLPAPSGATPLVSLRTENPAGMRIDILPNANLRVGMKIAFKVSTRQTGYLVLVDIDADGKLTQIYPNVMSLSRSSSNMTEANLIKPETPIIIPNPKNPLARFVFTADPPTGNGAIVAILSDKPVQIIDLPEPSSLGAQASIDALYQSVLSLKIASSDGSGKFIRGTWSFGAAPYVIE